jgi:hypothetical protein
MKKSVLTIVALMSSILAMAQTDVSLFWRKDSVQVAEIKSELADQYKKVGHHGPAVENAYMAVRLYFRDGGAIDVYSKANPGLELKKYLWYPTKEQIAAGAGCDEYRVGKTFGLGGVSLWDGTQEVKITATAGRDAKVWKTSNGACMEMLAKGVKYKGEKIDVAIRVIVFNDSRDAIVEAECVSGQKVQFMTGVNMHNGQQSTEGSVGKSGYMAAWGIHPADVVENPLPIGGGLVYNKKKWQQMVAKSDLMWIVSKKPTKKATTKIVAACSREKELNEWGKFVEYLKSVKM